MSMKPGHYSPGFFLNLKVQGQAHPAQQKANHEQGMKD